MKKAVEEQWKKDAKKFLLSTKDAMSLKIIKETPVGYVKLDIEMNSTLRQYLIRFAEQCMKKEAKENLLIEWAFVDLLKKRIKQIDKE